MTTTQYYMVYISDFVQDYNPYEIQQLELCYTYKDIDLVTPILKKASLASCPSLYSL